MAKARTYTTDGVITSGDKMLGTDAADNSTKNYTVGDLAAYIEGLTVTTTVTSTSYTSTDSDEFLIVDDDTAGGEVTITLPAANVTNDGKRIIKKIGTTGNVVVDASGSETIDGELTATLTTQYESITIVCNGSNWFII